MADPLSGVAIIICIAFGVLTVVLLFIFANRQIKRFSLKSKYRPHVPIAHDAPKNLQKEINRRLDVIKTITYHPHLLKKSDELYFEDENFNMPCHLYRMKALDAIPELDAAISSADPSKTRMYHQDFRVYLIKLAQTGLFGSIEMSVVHKFADLYELARHEPGEFNKEHYLQFIDLMTIIQESISSRLSSRHQNGNRNSLVSQHIEKDETVTKSVAASTFTNEKIPSNEQKTTFETSV